MGKMFWILLCVILVSLLFTACAGRKEVTLINDVEEADLWILPQTEDNLSDAPNTKAMFHLNAGEKATVTLDELGGPGTYIFTAIGSDRQAFYWFQDMDLEAGYTLHFKIDGEDGRFSDAVLEVRNRWGKLLSSERVFIGVL
ncbi:MAG: hypothetical protein IJ091_05060 [Oscillospiraceae bacterium]|nr:hypothetical protein [Oscillospiraceae bacterium]